MDLAWVWRHSGRIDRQRWLARGGGYQGVPVRPWENFDRDALANFLLIFEEERIRRDIHASVVDKTGTSSSVDRWQRHPLGGHHRPRPHRQHDGIRLYYAAVDFYTSHAQTIRSPNDARDSRVTEISNALHGSA